ncbi:MAG: dienelactone hydrolase family protein [Candidatus Lernaella stagnicola]|nr:dienelactone hydrolase family protein [Candidatus Lernaella stagnicola]
MIQRWTMFCVAIVFVAVLIAGCGHTQFKGALDRGLAPPAVGKSEIPIFDYDRSPVDISLEFKRETATYRQYFIKIRKTDLDGLKNKKARAFYFEQKNTTHKTPGLICLPPTGGPIEIAETFARSYAEQGYNTLAFYRRERFFNAQKDFEYNSKLVRQSVIDVRRGIDFLTSREPVDSDRIAVMGMSLGGILGALATAADGRVKATVMLVSAGDLIEVMRTSHYGRVAKFRDAMMKRYNLRTRQELIDFAEPRMRKIDPITYADRIDPARLLMINGYQDNIIKISAARSTWDAFGHPEWRTLPVGHYSAFALVPLAKKWTLEHFQRILDPAL